MMFGFAEHRRGLLEAELVRMVEELPKLGVRRLYVAGDLAARRVGAASELELVVVFETPEPYRRRPDFFVDHLRPRVGTRFHVYTPEEFEALAGRDPLLVETLALGEPAYAG